MKAYINLGGFQYHNKNMGKASAAFLKSLKKFSFRVSYSEICFVFIIHVQTNILDLKF